MKRKHRDDLDKIRAMLSEHRAAENVGIVLCRKVGAPPTLSEYGVEDAEDRVSGVYDNKATIVFSNEDEQVELLASILADYDEAGPEPMVITVHGTK